MLRDLELSDIPKLAGFAPEEWNMALDAVLLEHFGRGYFHARVSAASDRTLAVGQGIATGHAGWIGNIIVRPEARNRGLGSRVTQDIVELLRARDCSAFLLIATELGEPVYQKLGFRKTGEYVFLRLPRLPEPPNNLCEATPTVRDRCGVQTGRFCDRRDTRGPARSAPWRCMGPRGSRRHAGRLFPSVFRRGLVVASRPPAGLELLRFKHAFYPCNAVVPAGNSAALHFLIEHGAEETARAPRMALGDEVAWRPECIFARGAGYCG